MFIDDDYLWYVLYECEISHDSIEVPKKLTWKHIVRMPLFLDNV